MKVVLIHPGVRLKQGLEQDCSNRKSAGKQFLRVWIGLISPLLKKNALTQGFL